MSNPHESSTLSARWQQRFAFYDAYGLPGSSPAARDAYKALPFTQKIMLNSNFLAFLFGPIYFFVKGMWRKGLTLLGAIVVVSILGIAMNLPDVFARLAGFVFAALAMSTANYAYYLHTKGSTSWNLFEGLGRSPR
ncbi:DUF2628 domain-containing protein [Nocardia sp. NPDC051030]|uniref:DUF2628 domain-containing protein n=1 Tax=Nocardia sp. NPDC051030 TaxID=3155162 RepID=UPI00342DB5B4